MKRLANARQRGSIYLTVLGVSVLVLVLGLGSILAARVRLRTTRADRDLVQARLYAQSGIDLIVMRMAEVDWRTNWSNDTWSVWVLVDGGAFRFKVVDEGDGDLADDEEDPVRLHVEAQVNDAVRLCSVELRLEPLGLVATNLLENEAMENGAAGWYAPDGNATLKGHTDDAHGGAASLLVARRKSGDAGPYQTVTSRIDNGSTYYLEAWVKMAPGTGSTNARIGVHTLVDSLDIFFYIAGGVAVNDTEWTRVSAAVTPTWIGLLEEANFYVATESGNTQEFLVDDVMLIEGAAAPDRDMCILPGAWRQEILP